VILRVRKHGASDRKYRVHLKNMKVKGQVVRKQRSAGTMSRLLQAWYDRKEVREVAVLQHDPLGLAS
jgi:hypothetical protein